MAEGPYIVWDECDITEAEVKHRMEQIKAGDTELIPHCSKCGGTVDIKGMSDRKIEEWVRNAVYSDDLLMQDAWENFIYGLQELMDKLMDGREEKRFWYATGENIGWQHRSGERHFEAGTARELLDKILPKTNQFTLVVFDKKDSMTIKCGHHDAPTGEFYYIEPDELCCVCAYPREGESDDRICKCYCPTHGNNVFDDPAIGDHNECTDCHKKRLNGEIKDEED